MCDDLVTVIEGSQECETNAPKCSVDTEIVTKTQNVKICTPTMEKICPEQPCATCPLFCQSHTQIWCEDDFKVNNHEF